jgi:hypothetical protein
MALVATMTTPAFGFATPILRTELTSCEMRVHGVRWLCVLGAIWAMLMGAGAANACTGYYVCAPQDPFRGTVTNGNFTNIYLYPNPSSVSWDQHTATSLAQTGGAPAMTMNAIDGYVQALTQSTYFTIAAQYNKINPPTFSGRQTTVQKCVDPVVAYAESHSSVLSREILANFVGCQTENGGNKSDQVNIFLSPEFEAQNDVAAIIAGTTITFASPPIACGVGSTTVSFHTGQPNAANFTVIPTQCNTTMDALGTSLSHEMIELISDPLGAGYIHIPGGGDQFLAFASNPLVGNNGELGDLCQPLGLQNFSGGPTVAFVPLAESSLRAASYWSNQDNACMPRRIMDDSDILVQDLIPHRLGTGGGMTPDLNYSIATVPYTPVELARPVDELLLYTLTGNDDLCVQSHLDFHVLLTNSRPSIDFLDVNQIQYGPSPDAGPGRHTAWDNDEVHTVSFDLRTKGLKLSDITGFSLHDQSGHCTSDVAATADGWNVNRIAVYSAFRDPAPVLSLAVGYNLGGPLITTNNIQVLQGSSFPVNGLHFDKGTLNNSIGLYWTENPTALTQSRIWPSINGTAQPFVTIPRTLGDAGNTFAVSNIAPHSTFAFQVQDCSGTQGIIYVCTDRSNTVTFNSGAATPASVHLVLQHIVYVVTQHGIGKILATIPLTTTPIAANGSFSIDVTLGPAVTPGSYTLTAQDAAGNDLATTPMIVVAPEQFTPLLEFVNGNTGSFNTTTGAGGSLSSTGTGTPGTAVALHGEGFGSGAVTFTLDKASGTALKTVQVQPDGNLTPVAQVLASGSPGRFFATVVLPVTESVGSHTVFATQGQGSNQVQASAMLNVEAGP